MVASLVGWPGQLAWLTRFFLLGGLASLAGLADLTLKMWGPFPHNAPESNGAQSDPSCVRVPCIRALSRAPQQETRLNDLMSLLLFQLGRVFGRVLL